MYDGLVAEALKTLGLDANTTDYHTVKKQAQKMWLQHHPDKSGASSEKFVQAYNAWKQCTRTATHPVSLW